jgi:hypothetical protein
MDTACDDRRDSPEALKSVQECSQTWEAPEIVSQNVPQITVLRKVYMRSPCLTPRIGAYTERGKPNRFHWDVEGRP